MMAKIGRQSKQDIINRAIRAVEFIHNNRFFTIEDLASELCIHKNSARKWLDALSMKLPIVQVKPARYVTGYGVSQLPAIYKLERAQYE